MNNREKLKKLIKDYGLAVYDAALAREPAHISPMRDKAHGIKAQLDALVLNLNLDPVLETYEQAAKRRGWGGGDKTWLLDQGEDKDLVAFAGPADELCAFFKIERQIIDASKETT